MLSNGSHTSKLGELENVNAKISEASGSSASVFSTSHSLLQGQQVGVMSLLFELFFVLSCGAQGCTVAGEK